MRGRCVVNGLEAVGFVEAGGGSRASPEPHDMEDAFAAAEEVRHEGRGDAATARSVKHIEVAQARDAGLVGIGIVVEATNRNQSAMVKAAEQNFAGPIEPVVARMPVAHEAVDETVPLRLGFSSKSFETGREVDQGLKFESNCHSL
jgi:hypothetical protein